MKKIAALLCSLVIVLSGCASAPKKNNTPEETVKQYFQYLKEKDKEKMDGLLIEKTKPDSFGTDHLLYVKLIHCKERSVKGEWEQSWYRNPYDYACVDVAFDIHYFGGAGGSISNGTYNWRYYLVKENAESDWVIAMFGGG